MGNLVAECCQSEPCIREDRFVGLNPAALSHAEDGVGGSSGSGVAPQPLEGSAPCSRSVFGQAEEEGGGLERKSTRRQWQDDRAGQVASEGADLECTPTVRDWQNDADTTAEAAVTDHPADQAAGTPLTQGGLRGRSTSASNAPRSAVNLAPTGRSSSAPESSGNDEGVIPAPIATGELCSQFSKCVVHHRAHHYLFKLKNYVFTELDKEPEALLMLPSWSRRKFALRDNRRLSRAELLCGSEKGSKVKPLCGLSRSQPFELQTMIRPLKLKVPSELEIDSLLHSWHQYEVAFQPMRPILPPLVIKENFPRILHIFSIRFLEKDASMEQEKEEGEDPEAPLHIVLGAPSAAVRDMWVAMIRNCGPVMITDDSADLT